MNRDQLYFHFANLGLVIIGIFSIQKVVGPIIMAFLVLGVLSGFLFSWYIRSSRPPHIDTFIGMLSLASVVVILSRLYETEISFDNLLRIFSSTLAWLSLFQSFGLKAQKSYSLIQFISACLLISSVSLALESETVYIIYLAIFLFMLIFIMRLALLCEKQNLGSLIIGDRDEIMSLWHQIKVGAIMFSVILIVSGLVYPLVPRFNSLSLSWIPSTLLGSPEEVPLLKLLKFADKTIKDAKVKKEQIVDDGTKHRETAGDKIEKKDLRDKETKDTKKSEMEKEDSRDEKIEDVKKSEIERKETTERFNASDFKKDIDVFKIKSLTIKAEKNETPLDRQVALTAELKLADGTMIPATKLCDWKVTGMAKVSIDKDGKLIPKEVGNIQISASYMGTFSNDLYIKITEPIKPKKKKGFLFYMVILLLWIITLAIVVFSILVFIRSQKLSEMCKNNPKEFIKEVYEALCKALKVYGTPRLSYISYREFYELIKILIGAKSEPMKVLTEGFLEARFSRHEISTEHSLKAIRLFHEVKNIILERKDRNIFWRHLLFRIYVLDILLISR